MKWNRHRQIGYFDNVVDTFRIDEFKTFFRVSRQSVEYLYESISRVCREDSITDITDRVGSGGSPQKPLSHRILMTLWYLASNDKYASIADRFGMSESTCNTGIRNIISFINMNLRDRLIRWPTAHEQHETESLYLQLYNFRGVVGMIDGTHIPIRQPDIRGYDY